MEPFKRRIRTPSLLASPGHRGEVPFGASLIEGIACRFVIADRAYRNGRG